MKKKPQLMPLLNFFAETLEESCLFQAEIARRCGIALAPLPPCSL